MNSERVVFVQTEHGYGWSDNGQSHEWDYVPAVFRARVRKRMQTWYEKAVPTLEGQVDNEGHEFDGFQVCLSPRHEPWDGFVNLTLSRDGRRLDGFGKLDLASFND